MKTIIELPTPLKGLVHTVRAAQRSKPERSLKTDESSTLAAANTEELLIMSMDQLLSQLRTSMDGLTAVEAENRLKTYGRNELARRKRRTGFMEFLFHLRNPLVLILLVAGIVSVFLAEIVSASIIFFIVILSVVLDVFQEDRAERAAELLKEKVATTATVIRDKTKREVRLSEIVPGDIVKLSAGDDSSRRASDQCKRSVLGSICTNRRILSDRKIGSASEGGIYDTIAKCHKRLEYTASKVQA